MSEPIKPMRIKAFWSIYGPRVHRSGKNMDIGGDSWSTTAYHLLNRLENEGFTGEVEFYGPNAADLEKEYREYLTIK